MISHVSEHDIALHGYPRRRSTARVARTLIRGAKVATLVVMVHLIVLLVLQPLPISAHV